MWSCRHPTSDVALGGNTNHWARNHHMRYFPLVKHTAKVVTYSMQPKLQHKFQAPSHTGPVYSRTEAWIHPSCHHEHTLTQSIHRARDKALWKHKDNLSVNQMSWPSQASKACDMRHVNTPSVTWKQMVELFQKKRRHCSAQAGTYTPHALGTSSCLMISPTVGEGRNRTQGFVENPYNICQSNPSVKHFHLRTSICTWFTHSNLPSKKISDLEEGVEMQGGEPRKWLFQGPPFAQWGTRLQLSPDNPGHPTGRKRCCRLGGSQVRTDSADLVMARTGRATSWCQILKSPRAPSHHRIRQQERQ